MIYPEDVKEASRILKIYQPFGSKPWPGDESFSNGKRSSVLRNILEKKTESGYKTADPEHVVSILSQFWGNDDRQRLYDKVKAVSNLSKRKIIHSLGSGSFSQDSYEMLLTRKLWFEVAKTTLDPAGKSDPAWIKENGQCLENLIPRQSTIPDAGFGGKCSLEGILMLMISAHTFFRFFIRFCTILYRERRHRCPCPCFTRDQQGNSEAV